MFSFGAGFYDLAANDIIIHSDLFPITIDREPQSTIVLPIVMKKTFYLQFLIFVCLHYSHSYNKYRSPKQTIITASGPQGQKVVPIPGVFQGPVGGLQGAE